MGMDTIFDNLKSAGYKTALYGKWHVGYYQNEARPGSRGVDESLHLFDLLELSLQPQITSYTRQPCKREARAEKLSRDLKNTLTDGYV